MVTWIAGFVVAAAVGGFWWWQGSLENSQDAAIRNAAQRYGVEPALIKAVVWRESGFDPAARGRAGEIGLMQLREDAAREWADAERLLDFDHEHCRDPVTNTLAGTFYLRKLLGRFAETDNPKTYALAAYNAGRGNALRWNGGAGATNSAVFLEQITFPSTRAYVKEILERYDYYRPAFEIVPQPMEAEVSPGSSL
ncbi:MAG TPA: lytic transglycosylase domain-containing protein [Clostridia bacterium]|nr:lytic transglycosylase domain-containing protein [Clostridia bacterium]